MASADLLALVAPVLNASKAFRDPRRWSAAVVILRCEERRVTSRADHTHFLAANALPAQARECLARRVPPGHVLVYFDVDTRETAGVGFVVFDLATAVRARA